MSESEFEPSSDEGSQSADSETRRKEETPTITLQIEVEAPGATEDQLTLYRGMADLFERRYETFVQKNLDYGSSFLTAGKVDNILGGEQGPFDSAREANLYKLFTRIQDKDQRFYQQAFSGGDNLVDESAAETAGDAGVYWFMVEWLLRYNDG